LQYVTPRLLDLFKSRRNEKLAQCYLGPEYGYDYTDWLQRIHEGENFERYRQTIREVAQFMAEVQKPGMMVTLPEAPIPDRFAFSYDKVIPLWREAGIPVLDNLGPFVAKYPQVEATGPQSLIWGINPADGHPGPRSTSFLARQTADRLEQDYPQFLGPKTTPAEAVTINDWLPYDLNLEPVSVAGPTSEFELTYPASEAFLPTMPLEIPTVLIGLEQPVKLSTIRLSGAGLKSARIWLSTYDPVDAYDTQGVNDLGLQQGSDLTWKIPDAYSDREASVIHFQAEVLPQQPQLRFTLQTSPRGAIRAEGSP
jgi:hypothetical protein